MLEVPDWGFASLWWFGYPHLSLVNQCSKFWLSILILSMQRTSMSFKSLFGAFEDAEGSWLWVGILILIWMWSLGFGRPQFQILALYLDFEGAKIIHVLKVLIWDFGGRWRFLTGVWHLDLWFGYGHWSLIYLWSKFWISILILKVQRTSMSFKSSFGALEDAGGSWLGFGILILIWIWSLVFDIPMNQILALYLDFKGAKNINVL